jgi:hypothetical protein
MWNMQVSVVLFPVNNPISGRRTYVTETTFWTTGE